MSEREQNSQIKQFRSHMKIADLIDAPALMPAWTVDGTGIAFVEGPAANRQAVLVTLADGKRETLIDVPEFRGAFEATTGEPLPGQGLPFEHFAFVSPTSIQFAYNLKQYGYDLNQNIVTCHTLADMQGDLYGTSEAQRMTPRLFSKYMPLVERQNLPETLSPDGRHFVSIQNYNVAVRSTNSGRITEITSGGTEDCQWDVDTVHPLAALYGIGGSSCSWSPDGQAIAVSRINFESVNKVPQLHLLGEKEEVVYHHSARAGGTLETVTLYIVSVQGKQTAIQIGDVKDYYVVFAGWHPSGKSVLVLKVSRNCRTAEIYLADRKTGDARLVFSESSDSFLRTHYELVSRDIGLLFTADGQNIIWSSEESGYRHLYLYDLGGERIRALTSGDWPVAKLLRVDAEHVYFKAHSDTSRPYDSHLCRAHIETGEWEQLTQEEGIHDVQFSPFGSAFVDRFSSLSVPPTTVVRGIDGSMLAELAKGDISALEASGWNPPREFTVTAADGETELWGVMYLPYDFDPKKKYPMVEDIYGGPQGPWATRSFLVGDLSALVLPQALAQLGYVVVRVDGRGAAGRSKSFQDAVRGDWAKHVIDDHRAALTQLCERHSFIDSERIGIFGHSWGGYYALRALADAPDFYRAGVASAPAINPYVSILYEPYLGLPEENPQAYHDADLLPLAANITGPVMLVCGTADQGTWADFIKMSEALIRCGRDHEVVPMPGQFHGYDNVHDDYYCRKLISFFARNLG